MALAPVLVGLALTVMAVSTAAAQDIGRETERRLRDRAPELFGIETPLPASAPPTTDAYRRPQQTAGDQLLLAPGLHVEYLTRDAADYTDMLVLYPPAQPTHLLSCVEGRRERLLTGKLNPSVQRINLDTGKVETVLRGMDRCDGIRATPWGTLLVTEETRDGGAYEILEPLRVTELSVLDRATGQVTDRRHIAKRPALPIMAWEGIAILNSGVIIAGDELRPGDGHRSRSGGSIYKFIPDTPRTDSTAIRRLDQSPLVAGQVAALQVSCLESRQQHGQGCEVGNAAWLTVEAKRARSSATERGATGYHRPEDLELDPGFRDPEHPAAIRFCWANTGDANAGHYGEVLCAVDRSPLSADPAVRSVQVTRFLDGDPEFNSFDNLAFQPGTGNLYVLEDHPNGDVLACLPDGADRDLQTDGCVRIASVKDSSAEPTGLLFSADGATAYLVIQHSDDTHMPRVDGYPTDDILKITGFRPGR